MVWVIIGIIGIQPNFYLSKLVYADHFLTDVKVTKERVHKPAPLKDTLHGVEGLLESEPFYGRESGHDVLNQNEVLLLTVDVGDIGVCQSDDIEDLDHVVAMQVPLSVRF